MTAKQGVNKDGVNTGVNSKKTTYEDTLPFCKCFEIKTYADVLNSKRTPENQELKIKGVSFRICPFLLKNNS